MVWVLMDSILLGCVPRMRAVNITHSCPAKSPPCSLGGLGAHCLSSGPGEGEERVSLWLTLIIERPLGCLHLPLAVWGKHQGYLRPQFRAL